MENVERIIEKIMLRHVGSANAITSAEVARIIGNYLDDATHYGTRQAIRECLENSSLPIASNGKGYFLISSEDEFADYMNNLSGRISGIQKRMRMVLRAWTKVKDGRSIYSHKQVCIEEIAE